MRTVVVTGARGFIGKNLIQHLKLVKDIEVLGYDVENPWETIVEGLRRADFVYHLAGVNRPKEESEFESGNRGFTEKVLECLTEAGRKIPVVLSSSTQAERDNPYGISKRQAEEAVMVWAQKTGGTALVYRLPNVFGKWCRPNYNSAVATFCHNIAHDLPIQVSDPEVVLNLVYVDDVAQEFVSRLVNNGLDNKECTVEPVHQVRLGDIVDLIYSFKESRNNLAVPDMRDGFTKKLYATYLSYLPEDGFSYPLTMLQDARGSFTEFLRTPERGQVSVNITKPGITKGNHWHHTKNEKFLVVSGEGVIRFRKIDSDEVIEYFVNGNKLEVVDIPTGYTHNIQNVGQTDLVTVMWANESFDPEKPDTVFLEV